MGDLALGNRVASPSCNLATVCMLQSTLAISMCVTMRTSKSFFSRWTGHAQDNNYITLDTLELNSPRLGDSQIYKYFV